MESVHKPDQKISFMTLETHFSKKLEKNRNKIISITGRVNDSEIRTIRAESTSWLCELGAGYLLL